MSHKILKLATATCLASALGFGVTVAMADTSNPLANVIYKDATKSRALQEYWTPNRLKSATPVAMQQVVSPDALKKIKKRSLPGVGAGAAPVSQMLIKN